MNLDLLELKLNIAAAKVLNKVAVIKVESRLEKDIHKAIELRIENEFHDVAWIQSTNPGVTIYRVKSLAPGVSDIIGQMKDGRFLAIEVKRPGEKPTTIQKDFLNTVKANNGLAFVCDDEMKLDVLLK